jgi:glycosyltransferase involved in cell wall biosynthesis
MGNDGAERGMAEHGVWASVVIPALNEEEHIGACLSSLRRLRAPGAVEVIVVDNGSTDKTIETAESFRHLLDVRVLRKPGVSIAAVRNCGAAQARGALVAFLDADCVVPEGWLATADEQLTEPGCGMVGAFYSLPAAASWVARTWVHHVGRVANGEVEYLGSHNMTVRRAVFHRIGGFDESLQTNEDVDLCQRLRRAGLKVIACDAAAVIHLGTPQTLRDFFRRERWHGRHVLKVFLRNIRELQNGRAVLFAVFTLGAVATTIGGVAAALFGRGPLLIWSPGVALLAASFVLSVAYARGSHSWDRIPALTVLFLTWGLARAIAMVDIALPSALLARKWNS